MSDKKHIDRLFQENFKDFEAAPSDAVWENIEAKLNEKKKKHRVIPIWWRYAGVAALLLLLLTVGINYFNTNDGEQQSNEIVDTNDKSPENQNDASNTTEDFISNNNVVTDNNSEESTIQNASKNQTEGKIIRNSIDTASETSIAETVTSSNLNKREKKNNAPSFKTPNKLNSTLRNQEQIASNVSKEVKENNSSKVSASIDKNKVEKLLNDQEKSNSGIAQNNPSKEEEKETVTIADNSLSIVEELNKAKNIIEEEKNLNRWSIAPNAAPVYFNTLGEGSSIDPQFVSNSKSGELNMSYGVSASYAINKKLSVRSGINKVNLGYNTNNVVVFQSVGVSSSASRLQNVETVSDNSAVNDLSNTPNIETTSVISGEAITSSSSAFESFSSNATINQALGYIEVPLEFQYTLSSKKFGVNVIGGFSSFFLNENEIFSEDVNGTRTFLGEANNINKVSYSANFGLGLNYKITKKLDLNLEPMFKYQINTFNNTSGDFQPFFIGVYTGFAIKF